MTITTLISVQPLILAIVTLPQRGTVWLYEDRGMRTSVVIVHNLILEVSLSYIKKIKLNPGVEDYVRSLGERPISG